MRIGCFWIDGALSHNAPECLLNMRTGAAESIIEIEMPESGIEIIPPKQAHHAPAKPDALRISRRTGDHP